MRFQAASLVIRKHTALRPAAFRCLAADCLLRLVRVCVAEDEGHRDSSLLERLGAGGSSRSTGSLQGAGEWADSGTPAAAASASLLQDPLILKLQVRPSVTGRQMLLCACIDVCRGHPCGVHPPPRHSRHASAAETVKVQTRSKFYTESLVLCACAPPTLRRRWWTWASSWPPSRWSRCGHTACGC